MLEELVAAIVYRRYCGVGFENALSWELLGEVFAGVEKFEEVSNRINVEVYELNLSRLSHISYLHLTRRNSIERAAWINYSHCHHPQILCMPLQSMGFVLKELGAHLG